MVRFGFFIQICFLAIMTLTCAKEYKYAIDLAIEGSPSTFKCLYLKGYTTVFFEAYNPKNGGTLNPNLIPNMKNSAAAGLKMEAYVSPATADKTGAAQFDAAYNYMSASGFKVTNIWLK
uniref:Lysozyme n=1 Tax=Panagrolaimus sp. PS1159 TaxID=55785 RepID=A0AC35FSI3_9BILA